MASTERALRQRVRSTVAEQPLREQPDEAGVDAVHDDVHGVQQWGRQAGQRNQRAPDQEDDRAEEFRHTVSRPSRAASMMT